MNTTTNKKNVQILVNLCAQKGIKRVVVSPGSRNAPLSIAFNREKRIECFVVVDERSAAFFALGMAQKSGEPVAIVCTSGTALLNYAPAVAEAFYQRIPLLVLSADRPTEWIEQDDSQAINQQQVFSNFVKKSYQLPVEINCSDEAWQVNRMVNEAINTTICERKGPVHINVPLREPLYEVTEKNNLPERVFEQFEAETTLTSSKLEELKSRLPKQAKIMILSGFLPENTGKKIIKAIQLIKKQNNIIFLAEAISNIQDENILQNIDRVLNVIDVEEIESFRPDLLISFGGSLVSKQIKNFIKNNPPIEHWYIGKGEASIDTFRQLTALIQVEPSSFLEQFFDSQEMIVSNYATLWREKNFISQQKHTDFLSSAPWSDLKVFDILHKALPQNSDLQLANSSAVRYAHLFKLDYLQSIQSNRGTSGIDGSTSTAVGAAQIHSGITTFITGDLSFFYDSNALWNRYLSSNLRIIVIKNGGGSLFRFIPGPSDVEELDEYFEAAQDLNIEQMANLYGLPFYCATTEDELSSVLPSFFKTHDKAVILEISTPRLVNDKVLKAYFAKMRERR